MVLSEVEAKKIVLNYFNDKNPEMTRYCTYAINDKQTYETSFGWVFDVDTKEYFETGEQKYKLLGMGPVVVEKQDQSIHILSVRYNREVEVNIYRIERLKFLPVWLRVIVSIIYTLAMWIYHRGL